MPKSTNVQLADGRIVRLTDAQVRAVKAIRRAGTYYAYDGISRATIRALERLDLITVEWKTVWVETSHGYRGVWKQRPQLEWAARINEGALNR
jgi:hypothetical protein